MTAARIRLGISSCLLGQSVRYDGGHKHNEYITATLGEFFEFVPFCPEVAIGLGVPRPPIRLVRRARGTRALGVDDPSFDVTDALIDYAKQVVPKVERVSGYIFKKNSPSCGMGRVKRYRLKGAPVADGVGLYAAAIMQQFPELPCEEEGRLMRPGLRESFLQRVFVYHRWQRLQDNGLTPKSFVLFHTRHKFTLLAHDERIYRQLGRWVADTGRGDMRERADRYIRLLMQALKRPATPTRHANVLEHVLGFLKQDLTADDKREMLDLISRYRRGEVPLIVPITLVRHHLRRFPHPYLADQHYLDLEPGEALLRNAV